jgi:hypothetical protein
VPDLGAKPTLSFQRLLVTPFRIPTKKAQIRKNLQSAPEAGIIRPRISEIIVGSNNRSAIDVKERCASAEPSFITHCLVLANDESPDDAVENFPVRPIQPIRTKLAM